MTTSQPVYILGLSFGYHDSAAALIRSNEIVAACHEERFSRNKNDSNFPYQSIKFCLEKAGISTSELSKVAYYENANKKLDRILKGYLGKPSQFIQLTGKTLINWHHNQKFDPKKNISERLNISPNIIVDYEHHQSHAGAAFLCSPFEEATVITIDGVGEWATSTVSMGKGHKINRVSETNIPHSVGLFYSAFTDFLGFNVNEGEYKVMGMSAFGKPRFKNELLDLWKFHADGSYELSQKYFNFQTPAAHFYNELFLERFGTPNPSEQTFMDNDVRKNNPEMQHFLDIASSVQACTEEVLIEIVNNSINTTGQKRVCMSGGVALNSLANARLVNELDIELFVQPSAGDAGNALGAALTCYYENYPDTKIKRQFATPYLGRSFTNLECYSHIKLEKDHVTAERYSYSELIDQVSEILAQGNVIGWFQGRSEWGPRALGNRSILASPLKKSMQDKVNKKIKYREPFRPFAPVTLKDKADLFFDIKHNNRVGNLERYMLAVHNVTNLGAKSSPATTHFDGTARVQIIDKSDNERLYDLITGFERLTKVPILMNTSFNLRGEPIVDTPRDALRTFLCCELDYLVLENFVVSRKIED